MWEAKAQGDDNSVFPKLDTLYMKVHADVSAGAEAA